MLDTLNGALGKTAPNSHNTAETYKVSYAIKCDWITLRLLCPEPGQAQDVIKLIEQTLRDSFTVESGPIKQHHQTWDWQAVSVKGIRAWWHNPGNGPKSMGRVAVMRLEFSGKVLGSINSVDLRDLCSLLLGDAQAVCTRFDIALDDYTKSLWTWDELTAAARDGNYAGPKQHSIIQAGDRGKDMGITVYFGNRRSEAFYRFYDKDIESGGEIKANRMELELKRTKAHQAFLAWLAPDIGDEAATIDVLRGFLTGNIRFLDRSKDDPNLDRLEVLPFWASMIELLGEGVKLSPIRAIATIERSLDWLQHRVFPTIAACRRALGQEFDSLMESFMEYGRQHQNKRHDSMVMAAQLEGWGV